MRRLVPTLVAALAVALSPAVALPALDRSPGGSGAALAGAAATGADCTQALALAVPGAGQGSADVPGTADAGKTLQPLLDRLVGAADARGRAVETATVHLDTLGPAALRGRGTQRTPASRAVTRPKWKEWRAPVPGLTGALRRSVESAVAACPDQLLYLVGYAQGAEAVHRYLSSDPGADIESRTVSTLLVADPARAAGSAGPLFGDPRAPRSASGITRRFDKTPPPAVPARGWLPPVHSACTRSDLACDLSAAPFRKARRTHTSYHRDPMADRLVAVGADFGHRLAQWPVPAADQEITGRVGLVLSERLQVAVDAPRRELRWKATSALPPGLELTPRGRLKGEPTAAGSYEITYTVRNTTTRAVSRPMPGSVAVTINADPPSQTSAGGRHTCAVRGDGSLWCWGANYYGQLGTGDTVSGEEPRRVGSRNDWSSVSAGGMHTCAVRDNGSLWCWGLNYRGQLGLGGRSDKNEPKRVGDAKDWRSVSAGWVHTCATRDDGSGWCFGNNAYGQLGDGSRNPSFEPTRVSRGGSWRSLEAGGWHTCGVGSDGSAWCWGRNLTGQVGDGTVLGRTVPARIGQDADWVSLQPSWSHTCGLKNGGAASCWGGNEAGQLGGADGDALAPRSVSGGHTWSRVVVGAGFSCGIDTARDLWCWGTGRYGQLGTTTSKSATPVLVEGEQSWVDLDAGWLHQCGLRTTGLPYCWGNDENGQLGPSGTTTRAGTPPEVQGAREQEPTAARQSQRAGGFEFNLVTYNVLGSNHSSPRRDAGEYTPARIRSEWSIDYLRSINASVVGFQEMQKDQVTWFVRAAGDEYDVWPGTSLGGKGVQTTIAWKQDTWNLLETDHVAIPFIKQTRYMPLVKLEHRATGRRIWVMNVHNAPRDYQAQRNEGLRREIRRLKEVTGKGAPVFLSGDFNERHRAFCEVTGKLDMVAPRGGDFRNGECFPPEGRLRVDWIFGSRDVAFSGYREDRSPLVQLLTDHAVLRAHVAVP